MFDGCYLRLGQGPFVSCSPLTVELLASFYALPAYAEPSLRAALEQASKAAPWAASFKVAPEQTATAVGAMLRQVMLATPDLESDSIDTSRLPQGERVRVHLDALRELWALQPDILPADLGKLKALLGCMASDALQPIGVIWDRDNTRLSTLERVVLERLESHHGRVEECDGDVRRLIADRKTAAAPAGSLLGHVQRHLLDPAAETASTDESLAVLSVRDGLTECESAAAIIQRWLAVDESLRASDIGIIIPDSDDYALYLAEIFARTGLVASSLPAVAERRNIGAEAVLLFVQCRRRPAPAMALASLNSSPALCWPAETGAALATKVMAGDFNPVLAKSLTGRAAALYALIRSPSPSSAAQFKEQLRQFGKLLSDEAALQADVLEAKVQIARLIAALTGAPASGEPDWEQAIQFAAAYQSILAPRGAYYLGGLSILRSSEAPARRYRKLLVLGFNDGHYPPAPSGNPFFLDSEISLIHDHAGLVLPSQAKQLSESLDLFCRQLRSASEQVVLLLSERDRTGGTLAPSSSLPLIARLVAGIDEPEKLVVPLAQSEGSIWDSLIAWRARPEFKAAERPEVPPYLELGRDLLCLRRKEDGSPKPQSPSRLETLLVSPLAWLLGELDAKHVSWQPEQLGVALRGSLAHEVFERLFTPGTNHPDDATIEAQVPEFLLDRIRAIAPFLQSPTWVVERRTLEAEIIKAGKHWSMVLNALDAEIVGNEFWLAGSLFGHPVHGKADCLLRLPDGQPLVVDYKKSGTGNRRKRLNAQWDMQVDLYRKMDVRVDERSSKDVVRIAGCLQAWQGLPGVAYHLLNDGGVLINGADGLDSPHVEIIAGDIAENALTQIEARFTLLKAGRLETNTTADEKYYRTKAALGTYAFEGSPLIVAFMREDEAPSTIATGDAE